jgi:aldehyde dehydrogenase (NAD+)
MKDCRQFYINGTWVAPTAPNDFDVINPATEASIGTISLGTAADVDKAVAAARAAFESFSETSREARVAILERIIATYQDHYDEIAETIALEMGAPIWLAKVAQAASALGHLQEALRVLKEYQFEEQRGTVLLRREPIGVCGMITPWNWPLNQIACKVAPALAAGCTMVLKPSEVSPLSGYLWTQVLHEAGVPAGVFNMVNGDGPIVGAAISSHPGVDMVSFTGSTRAGVAVAQAAAPTVKRVTQELGGKSANIILDDADIPAAVKGGVQHCFLNSGQSCNAPTRMLVPRTRLAEAVAAARSAAEETTVGDPFADGTRIGPVVSKVQFDKIQRLIQKGIDEGAELVTGGPGLPDGMDKGYFVRPTVFSNVRNDMTIAREEIFGPVLSILPYDDDEDAITIANDTPYGLSGYVSSGDIERARRIAKRIRSGNVHVNGAMQDFGFPFGGYKQSGNGREWGEHGFEEFLEVKSVFGYATEPK